MYERNLLQLFMLCSACFSSGCEVFISTIIGTFIAIEQVCRKCGERKRWLSGPYIGSIPAGNIMLSGAIMFSGCLPGKVLRCLKFLGVSVFRYVSMFILVDINVSTIFHNFIIKRKT